MERDIVWSFTRVNFRTFVVQYFHMPYVFLEDFDIANYADDITPCCAGKSVEFVVNNLEQYATIFFEWHSNNYMKLNTDKSHLLPSGNSRATATIDNSYLIEQNKVGRK